MLGVVLDPMNFNVGMRFEYVYQKENLPQMRNTNKNKIKKDQNAKVIIVLYLTKQFPFENETIEK